MKWIDGFFMAWGMFTIIPCPRKKWNELAKIHMLAMLPFVGIVAGALWTCVCYAAERWIISIFPDAVGAALVAVTPWVLTGFMHLDGYMDVCDAVLSRRELSERRRILKDPHCGAFAVIAMVLLAIFQWSAGFGIAYTEMDIGRYISIACIPVAVRGCAALAVIHLKPMNTSQYAEIKKTAAKGNEAVKACTIIASVMMILAVTPSIIFYNNYGPLAAAGVYWLSALYAYKNLDGMNGDISGFGTVLGELAGLLVVTL